MKNTYKQFTGILLVANMTLISCYSPRYVFAPSTQNIPLLNRKNDLEVSGAYSGSLNALDDKGDSYNGADVQAAWAITDHLAAIFGESIHWEKNTGNDTYYAGDTSVLSYKRHFTEIGIGYYSPVNFNPRMKFQVFGGAAFGAFDINDQYTSNGIVEDKYHNSRPVKIFLQPSITYRLFKNSWCTFSSRITAVIFRKINTNYNAVELDNYILDSLTVSPVYFWEPSVNYTLAFEKLPLKLRLQGSLAILINHRFIQHRTGNIALGIVADFPKKRIHIKDRGSN
ncbi:MAG TPA: hypothetical protein VG847_13640 [Chitinophagaceae bacterium]|nr:hypothetical protein [Chitinophagaceae bacterium]